MSYDVKANKDNAYNAVLWFITPCTVVQFTTAKYSVQVVVTTRASKFVGKSHLIRIKQFVVQLKLINFRKTKNHLNYI